MAGIVAQRPAIAKTANGAIDEPRVSGSKRLVIDAKSGRHRGAKILDQNIGVLEKSQQQGCSLSVFEVDRDRSFAAIDTQKSAALPLHGRGVRSLRLAIGRLDLDHVGPEVGEK